jgi:hypothetical protein
LEGGAKERGKGNKKNNDRMIKEEGGRRLTQNQIYMYVYIYIYAQNGDINLSTCPFMFLSDCTLKS